jgi:hypothetical protein
MRVPFPAARITMAVSAAVMALDIVPSEAGFGNEKAKARSFQVLEKY